MTTVYISRHSKPLKLKGIDTELIPLDVDGEARAKKLSELFELNNIDVLYSSHYARCIDTAKYISSINDIMINIDNRLGERKYGINIPNNFEELQFRDWNYKVEEGESLNDVSLRIQDALLEILDANKDKKIMIVSHATAISAMLSKWCSVRLNDETKLIEIYFNDGLVFDGNWKAPELFKLEFNDKELISIKNIEVDYE